MGKERSGVTSTHPFNSRQELQAWEGKCPPHSLMVGGAEVQDLRKRKTQEECSPKDVVTGRLACQG